MLEARPMNVFDELIKALDSEDDLGKVIRSQIVVENILVQIIESRVFDISFLNKLDLTFQQKTNLAIALGLDKDWSKPLSCLGKIRNAFAHQIRGEIDKSDTNNFYESFTSKNKVVMQNLYKEKELELKELGFPNYQNLQPVHKFSLCVTVLAGALQAWLEHSGKIRLTKK